MSRRLLCISVLTLFPLLTGAGAVGAQEAPARDRVWLGGGLLMGFSGDIEEGLGGLARLTWQREPHQITLRLAGLADVHGFPDGGSDASLGEFGLLYGRTRVTSWGHAALSAGAAFVRFDSHCPGGSGRDGCGTVGVPITAEAAVQTTFVGLGLQAFGNINPRGAWGGVALFLQLGWMP